MSHREMPDPGSSGKTPSFGSDLPFHAACLLLLLVFGILEVRRAGSHTLWLDEVVGLRDNSRRQSVGDLLLGGARPQGSPSPLPYLVDKVWDRLGHPLRHLGLVPQAYHRLPSIVFTAGLAAAAVPAVSLQFT